jgi:hypothetical protein
MYIFVKEIFKTNLFIWFLHFHRKLNDLKAIHDLYSQCLTQILSKTTSNSAPEGVYRYDVCSFGSWLVLIGANLLWEK